MAHSALASACSHRPLPDGEHRPHTARSARSAQTEACDPAPSRRYRRFQSPWTQTALSLTPDTEERAVRPPMATNRPSSCARYSRPAARRSFPAGAAVDDRRTWIQSPAPASWLRPCSSLSVAAACPPFSPCSRSRTSAAHPRSPSTRPECIRSVRWSLRSEEHTSELQSQFHLVCRLLLEKKKN